MAIQSVCWKSRLGKAFDTEEEADAQDVQDAHTSLHENVKDVLNEFDWNYGDFGQDNLADFLIKNFHIALKSIDPDIEEDGEL